MASDPDELGRTATALVGGTAAPAAESPGATLGRYRLERELGAGGMGVVHAAFDPDLERRVALKVLRVSAPTLEAKDRLMREARAMARLSHPNVVTVHEVGTAHGRDFVAMELIHGDNLADWLRAEKRPAAQVIDAFVAAGRGLAAAHAAGIVHRDFKPHNVLRSRDGRIVVTDFGLAREAEGAVPVALDTTLPVGPATAATAAATPGSLSGLTMTGALLGTPAYMAPEQWSRGAVTPATDQFAYCVALWEALAGARPYPGPTLDDLRAQVARGPDALDASKIPRRLRKILRRGLAPDPAKRWPSMDALLARLVRAERRPGVALAIIAAAITAVVVIAVSRGPATPAVTCAAPARAIATVWSPAITAELIARGHAAQAQVLDAAVRDWQITRAGMCTAPVQVQAQLSCLDGVLARLDAVRQAYTRRTEPTAEGVRGQLIDAALCQRPAADLPRLALAPTPDVVAAYELYARAASPTPPADAEVTGLLARPGLEPCAHVLAALALDDGTKDRALARRMMSEAVSVVDQCGDDRLRADLLIEAAPYAWELPVIGPKGQAAIRQAQTAAARVMQPDITARLALLAASAARFSLRLDDAVRFAGQAIDGFGARGMTIHQARVALLRNGLRLTRATPEDLAAVLADVTTYRPIAAGAHRTDEVEQFDNQAALVRVRLGDVAGGQAALMAQWQRLPHDRAGRVLTGQVVDAAGRPIAGATVAAGSMLAGNSVSIVQPLLGFDESLRIATTDAQGSFTIHSTVDIAPIVAQHDALRSDPIALADHLRLVVRPTRTLRGRVALAGEPHTQLKVSCEVQSDPTGRYRVDAPIAADGSFVIEGASTGALRLTVGRSAFDLDSDRVEYVNLPASRAPVTDLRLSRPSSDRVIEVLVRSQVAGTLEGAQVLLVPGKRRIASINDLIRIQGAGIQIALARPIIGESAPQAVSAQLQAGDLIAHVEHAAPGELTVCAIAFTGDLLDPAARKRLQANLDKIAIRCEPIGPATPVVAIAVPPQKRFE